MQSLDAIPSAAEVIARAKLTAEPQSLVGRDHVLGDGPQQVVLDPSSGAPIAEFADTDAGVVASAVEAAEATRSDWGRNDAMRRARALFGLAASIRREAEQIAALESLDTGKPLSQARSDVETAAKYFEFYAGVADKIYGESMEQATGFAYTRREPFGVVAVITPWNSPIAQLARSVAPALAAGNTVVVKPSELTPLSSLVVGRLALEAGLPPGACNVLLGTGPVAGAALVDHPLVRFVSFTGSVPTGRAIARAAGDRVVGVSLELGGKSATLVLPDADLHAAASAGVAAVVRNAGQSCFATTRMVVHRSVHDRFVELMVDAFAKLSVGPGLGSPDLGPLVSAAQRDRSRSFVRRALADGAEIANDVRAAVPADGFFLRPHLMVNVRNDMELAREEVFGPVQAVIAVDDDDEAIAVANDSPYGLAAGVFTASVGKAHRYAQLLEAGQVQVNRYPAGGIDTPFGGYKNSGIGREKGLEALRHYTQVKTVIVDFGDVA